MLALITSESCPACKAFKSRIWPRLGMYLKKDNRFEVTEIHLVKNPVMEIRRAHTDLARFIGWVPILILFTGSSWVSTSLRGVALNGQFVGEKMVHYKDIPGKASQQIPMEHRRIYEWIERQLDTELFKSERPAVVITDDTRSLGRSSGNGHARTPTGERSMYNSETEFVENDDEYS